MERRILGKTGVEVAVLGFGCGAVGGLMVRGTAADQERAVARALALGINYFDTAPIYGNGESEKNLGRVLKTLRPNVVVGTKVRIPDEARGRAAEAVTASLEASLARLGLERVDLLQLHNLISEDGRAGTIERDRGARSGGARPRRPPAPGQDPLLRHHGARRHAGAPPRDRRARARHGAGLLQPAQSERRHAAAGGISGARLRRAPRADARGGDGHHRHPRPRRGRPERRRGAPSPRHPIRRSDRLRPQLRRRRRARAPARGAGAGGPRGQPRRGGDPLRADERGHDRQCSSATRRSSISSTPPPPRKRAPCPGPRSTAWPRSGRKRYEDRARPDVPGRSRLAQALALREGGDGHRPPRLGRMLYAAGSRARHRGARRFPGTVPRRPEPVRHQALHLHGVYRLRRQAGLDGSVLRHQRPRAGAVGHRGQGHRPTCLQPPGRRVPHEAPRLRQWLGGRP